ncbi:glycosyltransferase family 4 protein [Polynucleobacter sp. AP-Titi-500A-B4]|uniref:glycosyltransferase family 4 protein n=1 Tax=Polynucleobacter sp. AP-Titi-500A-B4 TaxID=2576923 RepID=UPI001BFD68C2|nr:glycosyltransferase family 4 protein [Polynucleobacter sp. AP-Titi-500A-B4]QWE11734.1 glycosyltransferase family 4 protein [Polynucleobacter sp. AP-Titi-500A-B4]
MKILFIHQNFPSQFKHLAPALAAIPGSEVRALTMRDLGVSDWQGVQVTRYGTDKKNTVGIHPWILDWETKIIRGEACYLAAVQLKEAGFEPDIIISNPGWGESLFIKQVWPNAKLGIYGEFYYHAQGADVGFDPEFADVDLTTEPKIRLKNLNNQMHFEIADAGISPTEWQASTFPDPFRSKITVIHDGIDTETIKPNPNVQITLNQQLTLTKNDEVITFVNRNLEPYRGCHTFFRALPKILKERPNAQILIVGGNGVSYGQAPKGGGSWRDIFVSEVRTKISDADWKRVHFLGSLPYDQFIGVLQLSTVHIYLTYPFVLSWSLMEAMSAGCAIVASNTQPLHELIQHDQNGRLVDFFRSEDLANEVIALLNDPDARKRLGLAARKTILEKYDLKNVCLPQQIEWVKQLTRL